MKLTSHRFVTTALLSPAILILAVTFLAPLGRLVLISFSSPKGLLYAYSQLFEDEIFASVGEFVEEASYVAIVFPLPKEPKVVCTISVIGSPVPASASYITTTSPRLVAVLLVMDKPTKLFATTAEPA